MTQSKPSDAVFKALETIGRIGDVVEKDFHTPQAVCLRVDMQRRGFAVFDPEGPGMLLTTGGREALALRHGREDRSDDRIARPVFRRPAGRPGPRR